MQQQPSRGHVEPLGAVLHPVVNAGSAHMPLNKPV
jgi:hypothetical protein